MQAHIHVGNAPCSWGVNENVEGARGGFARVLDEMQETGYIGTELGDIECIYGALEYKEGQL